MAGSGSNGSPRRLPAWRGVRGRSTAAAVLVVAVALLGGATAFVLLLQRDLIATVQDAAGLRATDVMDRIEDRGVQGLGDELATTTRTGQLLQVVDASGQVVAASSRRALGQPLTRLPAPDGQVEQVQESRLPLLDDDDPYLLVVGGASSGGEHYRIVVATPISAQQQSVHTALLLLLVGAPLLLLLVGAATWWLVGRTLRPVERIRRQVSEIGISGVQERVPVPATDDEIARLARTMNEMLGRLDDGQQVQRRFVADASHELRSPLATLAASVELSRDDETGGRWRELAPVVDHEITRLTGLVSGMLLLAKADEHRIALDVVDVDLDDLVAAEVSRLQAVAGLDVRQAVRPVRVRGDAARLGQALTNLTDNAARHARSQVRLTLAEESSDGGEPHALLVVEDDGPGIPPSERERVFERFVRLDDSRERSKGGSGLGLAIVREVVTAHGGSVVVGDGPDDGCRVELRLPLPPGA